MQRIRKVILAEQSDLNDATRSMVRICESSAEG